MKHSFDNWQTQIRKGYLELCMLLIVRRQRRIYGSEIIKRLQAKDLVVKEGTLYPMLSRMIEDNLLEASWDFSRQTGHPRKYYTLTAQGEAIVQQMGATFEGLVKVYNQLKE